MQQQKKLYEKYVEHILTEISKMEQNIGPINTEHQFILDGEADGKSTPNATRSGIKGATESQAIESANDQGNTNSTSYENFLTDQERRYRRQNARVTTMQRLLATIRSADDSTEAFLKHKEKQLR